MANIDIPPTVDEEIIDMIKYKWDNVTRTHFNGDTTSKMFSEWVAILDDCIQGFPLGHDGHHTKTIDHLDFLRGFETYRYENQ